MSGEFVPLGGGGSAAAPASFRPLGTPAESVAPVADEHEVKAAEELRRAFQAGYEQAREELTAGVDGVAEAFGKAIEELAHFRAMVRDRYERELLEVALGVAKKVVQQELQERPEIWLGMIRNAVHRAVDRERIAVRVPPPLLAFLRDSLPELRSTLDDVKEVELIEDPSLTLGGCVIESRFGEIDIGVESQIGAARSALVQAEG